MHNPIVVLVTVCVKGRDPFLARDDVVADLRAAWAEASSWKVGRFVVMPDHVHLFCTPATRPPEAVRRWVSYWKRLLSKRRPDLRRRWQPDCWDTQMRDCAHYVEKSAYVRRNPIRQHLARSEDEWPFQGEMSVIEWR